MSVKHNLGQYFTTNEELKQKMFEFILNNPVSILEPSVGRGDLVVFIKDNIPNIIFDMYEIDNTIKPLELIHREDIIYVDFIKHPIEKKYNTIVGNPPFVRTKTGNLYIEFIEKCYGLLHNNGELIFIVPSDFLKLTSASKLLNVMMTNGTITNIFHPHNEKLFENATVDVIVFRYCKNATIDKICMYNDNLLYVTNSDGLITFEKEENKHKFMFKDYFDIYVGIVCGKEEVYKNEELGNIEVVNGEDICEKYIYIDEFPCASTKINEHLLMYKQELIDRGIRKFNENNWFKWGAPRNIKTIDKIRGKNCIYVYTITRKSNVSFLGNIAYFGGNLLMLTSKKKCDLHGINSYINSDIFKTNFMFSGRFKIGHRTLSNSFIPSEYLY
jgi:adenine-specific DNA-methyltransferase